MTYTTIQYAVRDGIATVTLNRPDRLNAFTLEMGADLVAVLDEIDADDDVRVAVFTGNGRGFSAGADLSEGTTIFEGDESGEFVMSRDADYGGVIARRIWECTKPLIAAVNGPAVGVGLTTTLPMDFRIASERARFGFVFVRRGLVPEASSSWFLPRIVGISQAAEWVYTGRVFDAEEALRGGLVRSVHAHDDLLPAAYRLAGEIAESSSPVAVAISRRMLWQMFGTGTPETAHELDSRGIFFLGRAPDCTEGVQAFLEKRPPRFPMRVSRDLPEYVDRWRKAGLATTFLDGDPA